MSLRDLSDPASTTRVVDAPVRGQPAIGVDFGRPDPDARPAALLAAVRFGTAGPEVAASALRIDVELEPLNDLDCVELWFAQGPVATGSDGAVRYARDDHHLVGVIECDEREHGGIAAAAEATYAAIQRFQRHSFHPHLLRIWNYFDAINQGEGDLERYRQFCVGRARGFGDTAAEQYPAASTIGRKATTHRLQVYWLAARAPGTCVENPRQQSAYCYPREHGPTPPAFARATIAADGSLLVSGTASIVGHESRHPGDPVAQLEETIRNLDALMAHVARAGAVEPPSAWMKVYLRDPDRRGVIETRLRRAWPGARLLFLAADICRRELLLEIEAVIRADGICVEAPWAVSRRPQRRRLSRVAKKKNAPGIRLAPGPGAFYRRLLVGRGNLVEHQVLDERDEVGAVARVLCQEGVARRLVLASVLDDGFADGGRAAIVEVWRASSPHPTAPW